MNKNMNIVFAALAIMLLSITSVAAEPRDAQRTDVWLNDTSSAATIMSVVANGGNISHFNVSVEIASIVWTGLTGRISHSYSLEGASDVFYDWGTFNTTGTVLFSPSNTVDWNSIQGSTSASNEAEDTALGLTGETDSVNNTFTDTNAAVIYINGAGLDVGISGAMITETESLGGTNWVTALLWDTTDYVYATPIQRDNEDYQGDPADFQTMVPVSGATNTRTYYLYLAIE